MQLHEKKLDTDVLVIGGGSAGLAAAVAAAQSGLKVVLLEKNAFAGGNATAAYVGTICGLYWRDTQGDTQFAVGGFPREFALQLQKESTSKPYQFGEGLHFLPYDRTAFIQVADSFLKKEKVETFFQTSVIAVKQSEGRISCVCKSASNEHIEIEVKTIVDASGQAVFGKLGVSSLATSEYYQAAAQVFGMAGVQKVEAGTLRLSIIRTIQRGLADGSYPVKYKRLSVIPGSYKEGHLFFKLGIPLAVEDSNESRKALQNFSKEAITFITSYLQAHCDLFAQSSLTFMAPEVGIRTGPRHQGKETLTREDVLTARKRSNTIARGVWPIEFWVPGENPRMEYFPERDFYDISPGMLQSGEQEHLFFAGRHISAEEDAMASARVIGTCLQTGFAAGKLAAGKVLGHDERTIITAIQQELKLSEL
jgi:hypothetical protein